MIIRTRLDAGDSLIVASFARSGAPLIDHNAPQRPMA
jgi:hypothetical protein